MFGFEMRCLTFDCDFCAQFGKLGEHLMKSCASQCNLIDVLENRKCVEILRLYILFCFRLYSLCIYSMRALYDILLFLNGTFSTLNIMSFLL